MVSPARKNKIKVKLAEFIEGVAEARMPIRANSDDAGFDLYVAQDVVIPPHAFRDVPSGVSVELPNGYWGMLTGRSSTIRQRGLLVVQGIIDTGYTGELFSAVWNLTAEPVSIKMGERIAQLIILPNSTQMSVLSRADALGVTSRGNNGFGSSGR